MRKSKLIEELRDEINVLKSKSLLYERVHTTEKDVEKRYLKININGLNKRIDQLEEENEKLKKQLIDSITPKYKKGFTFHSFIISEVEITVDGVKYLTIDKDGEYRNFTEEEIKLMDSIH